MSARDDVTGLAARPTREGIELTWHWPQGCARVRVARRAGAPPDGPDDPAAMWRSCSLSEYVAAGERFVERLGDAAGRFHVAVYAQYGGVYAPGSGPGCRAEVAWEPWAVVRYALAVEQGPAVERLRLRWTMEGVPPDFAGFALVAGPSAVPESIDDGVELFRWAPWMDHAAGRAREAVVDLAPLRDRSWSRAYYKAFTVDPAQRHRTIFVHPNTCAPLARAEAAPARRTDPPRPRAERRSVVCPSCFERFAAAEILFASYDDEEPAPARSSLLDRLRGGPPRPPVGEHGRRLTRKLCPACARDLPYSAGVHRSLVVGLIGAKFSGKSHYVASLVRALEGRAGADFDASLVPVNDETQERYRREFRDPLFGRGLELPVTVGAPPPLIYDLSVGGAPWGERSGRSATLSLYDTAGENFDDREIVRRMLKYLGVASGVILLVDPLQVPAVRDALPAGSALPDLDRMADPHAVVSRVLEELEGGGLGAPGGQFRVPLAVVMTKCDVLRGAGLVEPNRLWSTEARHAGFFDRAMHEDMSGMFGEAMLRWSPATFATVASRFPRHAFFGISATGCASDPATRRYRHVTPWRVEEPLLWLLAELGLVPTR